MSDNMDNLTVPFFEELKNVWENETIYMGTAKMAGSDSEFHLFKNHFGMIDTLKFDSKPTLWFMKEIGEDWTPMHVVQLDADIFHAMNLMTLASHTYPSCHESLLDREFFQTACLDFYSPEYLSRTSII